MTSYIICYNLLDYIHIMFSQSLRVLRHLRLESSIDSVARLTAQQKPNLPVNFLHTKFLEVSACKPSLILTCPCLEYTTQDVPLRADKLKDATTPVVVVDHNIDSLIVVTKDKSGGEAEEKSREEAHIQTSAQAVDTQ